MRMNVSGTRCTDPFLRASSIQSKYTSISKIVDKDNKESNLQVSHESLITVSFISSMCILPKSFKWSNNYLFYPFFLCIFYMNQTPLTNIKVYFIYFPSFNNSYFWWIRQKSKNQILHFFTKIKLHLSFQLQLFSFIGEIMSIKQWPLYLYFPHVTTRNTPMMVVSLAYCMPLS